MPYRRWPTFSRTIARQSDDGAREDGGIVFIAPNSDGVVAEQLVQHALGGIESRFRGATRRFARRPRREARGRWSGVSLGRKWQRHAVAAELAQGHLDYVRQRVAIED